MNRDQNTPELMQAELEVLRSEIVTLKQRLEEHQASETQLSKERNQLEFILAKAASAITVQAPTGELMYANEAAAKIMGYPSAKALLATPLSQVMLNFELLNEAGQPFNLSRLPGRRVLEGEHNAAPEDIIRFRLRHTGEENWSLVRATPVLGEQSELQFVINVFHNITPLKEAEAALRVQREWFEVTLSSIGDAVIATDVAGQVTFMNKVAQSLTGWSQEAAIGQPLEAVFRIVNEYSRQTVENPVTKVLRLGTVVGLANHTVLLARDGREIPIDDSAAPIRGGDGQINGVVLVFRDVTERKEAEEKERFLAEASQILTSSLDYQATLDRLARLTLPRLADYCLIDLFEEIEVSEAESEKASETSLEPGEKERVPNQTIKRVVVAHSDPVKEKQILEKEINFLPDLEANFGIGKVLRTGEPAFVPQIGEAELRGAARNEEHLAVLRQLAPCSGVSVPLMHQGRVLGALSLFFSSNDSGRSYNQDGLDFVSDLAQRAALAVENARLYQKEQLLKTRQAYLARAGEVLSSSLDYETTLQQVAELAVPLLADWCTVHVVDEDQDQTPGPSKGNPQQVGLAHWNPAKVEWAKQIQKELEQRYPYDPEGVSGLPKVLRLGEAELYPDIPDELLVAVAVDEYQLQLMRDIGYSSAMIVPMIARNRILGAIQFVATTESGRHYTSADLAFATELARRAALAVDNARLYREAQQAIMAQKAVNQLKDRFLSIASHELRTPLTSIKGFAQLLQRQILITKTEVENANIPQGVSSAVTVAEARTGNGNSGIVRESNSSRASTAVAPDQERTRRILSNITVQVSRMDKLIGEMLDISRIQSGKLELKLTPDLNLNELVQRIIEQQQITHPNRVIQLEKGMADISGEFDEVRLEQVLNNLINNALKYSPNHKPVVVGLEMASSVAAEEQDPERAEEAIVWVRDEGYGISAEDQVHIFESFYRARTHENQDVDGLGLGLYISQQIIQLHQGRMWLKSNPGEGSIFYFALPLTKKLD